MKVSYVESLASYGGSESCVYSRKGVGEALAGVRAGRVLSREIHAPWRKLRVVRGAEAVEISRRPHRAGRIGEASTDPARSETPRTRANTLLGNREVPLSCARRWEASEAQRIAQAQGHTTMSNRGGKSDRCVVPQKLPNKAVGETPAAAEVVEGRRRCPREMLLQRACPARIDAGL